MVQTSAPTLINWRAGRLWVFLLRVDSSPGRAFPSLIIMWARGSRSFDMMHMGPDPPLRSYLLSLLTYVYWSFFFGLGMIGCLISALSRIVFFYGIIYYIMVIASTIHIFYVLFMSLPIRIIYS